MTEKVKCPNCGRVDYEKKIRIPVGDYETTVCDLCSPDEFTCALELRSGEHVISTGTIHAKLDWTKSRPAVVKVESAWTPPKVPFWRRFLGLFQRSG